MARHTGRLPPAGTTAPLRGATVLLNVQPIWTRATKQWVSSHPDIRDLVSNAVTQVITTGHAESINCQDDRLVEYGIARFRRRGDTEGIVLDEPLAICAALEYLLQNWEPPKLVTRGHDSTICHSISRLFRGHCVQYVYVAHTLPGGGAPPAPPPNLPARSRMVGSAIISAKEGIPPPDCARFTMF